MWDQKRTYWGASTETPERTRPKVVRYVSGLILSAWRSARLNGYCFDLESVHQA